MIHSPDFKVYLVTSFLFYVWICKSGNPPHNLEGRDRENESEASRVTDGLHPGSLIFPAPPPANCLLLAVIMELRKRHTGYHC